MAKLVKGNDWVAQLKGKGVTVIDNTGTVPEVVSKPMPIRDKDRGNVKNGKVKRVQTIPMSEVADVQARQDEVDDKDYDEVDAALHRSQIARMNAEPPDHSNTGRPDESYEFDIEPSGEVPFADLAQAAQAPEIAEEKMVVTTIEKVFDSTEPQSWDDLVSGAEQSTHERLPDFPPETLIAYVSIDVPEGVELVVKINGQEIL